ncbi:MAG: oligosaccharide flippase family protein [Candidatus Symbiothrix sp.]|jgi:PST family polysaccharide transporter|nr:oligosaccharide flippase family protein [Candidatus Symbiothrix sp.]
MKLSNLPYRIKELFLKHPKIVENYFFMTIMQVAGSFISIVTYPYLIRVLGPTVYGLYVFALSISAYFAVLVAFGFHIPALKQISLHHDDLTIKNKIVSTVMSAKLYLMLLTSILFTTIVVNVPLFYMNKWVFIVCFLQIFADIFFPIWYFQGVQKMKIVTYIQLGFRLLSIPLIFIFISLPHDLLIYAIIDGGVLLFSALAGTIYLYQKEHIRLYLVSPQKLKVLFKESLPFFWSSSMGILKQESVTIIIGSFMGLKDVALYDLACKIIKIPRMITYNINNAIFPKMMQDNLKSTVKKVIRYNAWIGLGIMLCIVLFGYWIVLLLGGKEMTGAYPLAIVLSTTILTWLVNGSYINFVFVPENRYYFVTKNQVVALITCLVTCFTGLLLKDILVVASSLAISGLCEIVYCRYVIKKYHLL